MLFRTVFNPKDFQHNITTWYLFIQSIVKSLCKYLNNGIEYINSQIFLYYESICMIYLQKWTASLGFVHFCPRSKGLCPQSLIFGNAVLKLFRNCLHNKYSRTMLTLCFYFLILKRIRIMHNFILRRILSAFMKFLK